MNKKRKVMSKKNIFIYVNGFCFSGDCNDGQVFLLRVVSNDAECNFPAKLNVHKK
jgi:hypothetical protein